MSQMIECIELYQYLLVGAKLVIIMCSNAGSKPPTRCKPPARTCEVRAAPCPHRCYSCKMSLTFAGILAMHSTLTGVGAWPLLLMAGLSDSSMVMRPCLCVLCAGVGRADADALSATLTFIFKARLALLLLYDLVIPNLRSVWCRTARPCWRPWASATPRRAALTGRSVRVF